MRARVLCLVAGVLLSSGIAWAAASPEALVKETREALQARFETRRERASLVPTAEQMALEQRLAALRRELVRVGPPVVRPLLAVQGGRFEWSTRGWVRETIRRIGEAAVPEITKALYEGPAPVSAAAFGALRWMYTPRATEAARAFLTSDSPAVAAVWTDALYFPTSLVADPRGEELARELALLTTEGWLSDAPAGYHPDRLLSLITEFMEEKPGGPGAESGADFENHSPLLLIVEYLYHLRDPRAFPLLVKLLDHPDPNIRSRAESALAHLSPGAAEQMLSLLDDPRVGAQEAALQYFGVVPLPSSAQPRVQLLVIEGKRDTGALAVEALAHLPSAEATPLLLQALSETPRDDDRTGWAPRGRLVRCLGETDDPRAVAPLLRLLQDPNEQLVMRETALFALTQLRAREAGDAVRGLLKDPKQVGVLTESLGGLYYLVRDPVALLLPLLENNAVDPQVRLQIAMSLGRARDRRALPALERMAKTPVDPKDPYLPGLRGQAVRAFGKVGGSEAVPTLLELLESGRYSTQGLAETLGEIGDPRAVPALQARFAKAEVGSYDYFALAVALGRLGDPQVIPALQVRMTDDMHGDGFGPSCPSYVHTRAAVEALAALGPAGVPALLEALDWTYGHTADYAALALGKTKDPRAFEPLLELLRHPDYRTRHHAAVALGDLGNAKARPMLRARLQDESGYVRAAAAEALWRLGERDVLPVLSDVLVHGEEDWEQAEAARVLARIGTREARAALERAKSDGRASVRTAARDVLAEWEDAGG